MPISSVILNVRDVAASVAFYTRYLRAELVGPAEDDTAVLDLVTARLELVRVADDAPASTWIPDDLQRGFRHVGFKVDALDPYVAELKAAGVEFHLDPLEATGGVRITFFRDPDGTLLELVERDLQYTEVLDADGVAAERALGVPVRPRFDHVALTVDLLDTARKRYEGMGFGLIGTIAQPQDPRGFDIYYLKSGDTVLEVFTYAAETSARVPQLDAAGFVAAVLHDHVPAAGFAPVGRIAGHAIVADTDGFTTAV